MLVFYSLVHSGESGKTSHEWLEGMECQLMLHILPLCFFSFGGVGKKALRGGKWQHGFWILVTGQCVYVCLCMCGKWGRRLSGSVFENMFLWMFGHSSPLWDVVLFYDKNEISRSGMKHGISMMWRLIPRVYICRLNQQSVSLAYTHKEWSAVFESNTI